MTEEALATVTCQAEGTEVPQAEAGQVASRGVFGAQGMDERP